jgi:hypothetical protein
MASNFSYSRQGLFIGILILVVGLILLLDQMGFVSANYLFRFFWPAVFICFGFQIGICRNNPIRVLVGVLMACFGVLLLFGAFGILHVGIETMWPLLLIMWGVWVIGRAFGRGDNWQARIKDAIHERNDAWKMKFKANLKQKINDPTAPPSTHTDFADEIKSTIQDSWNSWTGNSGESEFDHVAIFGGVKQRVTVKNFRGGRVLAICGGFEIDLSRADIEGQSAVIDANALMGGGEIRVPDTWIIEFRGVPLLGGYSDETHQTVTDSNTAKHLIIKGVACMGGVVIKN